MSDRAEAKQEDVHFRVLRLIEESPQISQRELAKSVGISLGALNFCLKALVARGQIKIRNFQSSNHKLAYTYLLTPSGIARKAELTARFLKRKLDEYEKLRLEIGLLQREAGPGSQFSVPSDS